MLQKDFSSELIVPLSQNLYQNYASPGYKHTTPSHWKRHSDSVENAVGAATRPFSRQATCKSNYREDHDTRHSRIDGLRTKVCSCWKGVEVRFRIMS